jgi:multicomponent Na+:H+ antiporter subunit G
MFQAVAPWAADVLVVVGVFIMTIGVYGIVRMPDTYTRMHAASKAVFLGVISLLIASMFAGDPAIVFRAALISIFLVLTTPVAAHMIAKAAYEEGEKMRTPGAVDQSGKRLNEDL